MTRDQRHAFNQSVETPDMAGVMGDQVDNHNRVDEVVIDEETKVILDERPFHVREVVGDHKQDAERPANPDHKSEDQRQSDQQVAPLHQEIGYGQHCRCRKRGEETMEGHDMIGKADLR